MERFEQRLFGFVLRPKPIPRLDACGRRNANLPVNVLARFVAGRALDRGNGLRPAVRLAARNARPRSVTHRRIHLRTVNDKAGERNSSPAGAAAWAWCRAKQECGPGCGATPGYF